MAKKTDWEKLSKEGKKDALVLGFQFAVLLLAYGQAVFFLVYKFW